LFNIGKTVSIGVLVSGSASPAEDVAQCDGKNIKELLKASDDSMYQVKENGRNSYRLHDETITQAKF